MLTVVPLNNHRDLSNSVCESNGEILTVPMAHTYNIVFVHNTGSFTSLQQFGGRLALFYNSTIIGTGMFSRECTYNSRFIDFDTSVCALKCFIEEKKLRRFGQQPAQNRLRPTIVPVCRPYEPLLFCNHYVIYRYKCTSK